ncbi:MAG: caspase family protein, partial [Proteobacteria bacterium]|nr:caspase family protein [Pseudomonadota bacterium]
GNKENHKGQLYDWVKPKLSRVVVYYAGHGAPGDREGGAYLVPSDADAARIELNGYPLSTLYANLSKLPAESVTVVIEACFSGASQGGSVISNASPVFLKAKAAAVPANITVIAAGGANQMASWEEDKSHGLFTKYFLKGMSGEADKKPYGDGDGRVGYGELDAYLKDTLTYYARRYYGRDQTARIVVGKGG